MEELSSSLSKLNIGLNRNTIDKFYTKPEIVSECLDLFDEHIKFQKNSSNILIEPAAGNGAFLKQLVTRYLSFGVIIRGYDIAPEQPYIIKQDYLQINTDKLAEPDNHIHVIGNPPFGRQSSLAKQFIKKSAIYADSISFILPKSFKKISYNTVFPLCFHMVECVDLPALSFLVNNVEQDVPCVFQIWIRKNTDRITAEPIQPPNYIQYVKSNEKPDIAIRRVGVYAGQLYKILDNKSPQSHYFIRLLNFKKANIDSFVKKYNTNPPWKNMDNTVGPKSISKPELNAYLSSLNIKEIINN